MLLSNQLNNPILFNCFFFEGLIVYKERDFDSLREKESSREKGKKQWGGKREKRQGKHERESE